MEASCGVGWLHEQVHPGVVDAWRLYEVVRDVRTPYQRVRVARTSLGTTLFCDDNVQSAECGQLAFHEAECVPAMALVESARSALVIGCSEGTVPLILAEAGFERIDHVDLDVDCLRICAEDLPYGFTTEDVRVAERGRGAVRLHYGDGVRYVRDALADRVGYDLIVLDLPEEHDETDGGSASGRAFLARCRDLLNPGGVVSTHVCRPYVSAPTVDSAESLVRAWQTFGELFGTRVYFRSDEQPWAAVMLGRADAVAGPVNRMCAGIDRFGYKPRTLDSLSLRRATHLPRVLTT